MKKIFTLLLVLAGMVSTASAQENIYLRSNLIGGSWSDDLEAFRFTYVETVNDQEEHYIIINSSQITTGQDVWFRLHYGSWGSGGAQICPYAGDGTTGSYTFSFNNGAKGATLTYGARYAETDFQGSDYSWGIPATSISASQYKITLYKDNVDKWSDVDNKTVKRVWIKVEINKMPVTIGSTGKATYYCDRALDFTDMDVSAYTITGSTKATGALTAAKQTSVPANTGLYLEGTPATYNVPVIANFESEDVTITGNMLKGSVTQIDNLPQVVGDKTNYILTINTKDYGDVATPKFYKVNSGGNTLLANKAYLQIPTASAAREFFWFEDELTGVEATLTDSNSVKGEVFDLQGRRIAQPTKGLYIVNGKKVFY